MTIKINNFIKTALDIYTNEINIEHCSICGRSAEKIIVKHGFDRYLKKIFEVEQYCKFCYKKNNI